MPSNNSYTYYDRFLMCLQRHLENLVEKRKKDEYVDEPEILFKRWIKDNDGKEKRYDIPVTAVYEAFKYVFDEMIEKAPSACMGGGRLAG